MRAGKLDKSISIERLVTSIDEFGVAREAWTPIRTLKAQIVQASSEEFLRSAGEGAESVMIFRIRYVAGMTPANHRIRYTEELTLDIKEIKEIGRRRGLEIRTVGGTRA